MKLERIRNATRNVVWGVIEKIATLILGFATRTVLIHTLGTEYLGLNSLFTSILSVLSISELGFGTAIAFSMYRPIAEDDNDTLCALLNVYRKIYRVVGTIILTVGLAITPFLPYLIKGTYPADINLYLLYFIYLFNTVISYFMYAYKAVLFSAHQRNDLASKRATIIQAAGNILRITLLFLFKNYYVYAIILPLITLATNLVNAYLASKLFPNAKCAGSISPEMKDGIKKRIIGLLSFKIYNVIFASVDSIVISAFLGIEALGIYDNYHYIQSAIVGFLTIFTASITAGIGNKMVTNAAEDNYKDYKNVVFINGWLVSWCSVCLVCLYQHFMGLWVGSELTLPFHTMILMVLYFFLPRITTLTYTYREAAGLWWEDRFRPLVSTVVNLVTNIILVQLIGMDGVIISTLICTVFINVPWGTHVLFKNYFKRTAYEYFMQLLYYAAITILASVITFGICSLLPGTGIISLVVKCGICTVFPNIVFAVSYHRMSEFGVALKLAKRFLRRK